MSKELGYPETDSFTYIPCCIREDGSKGLQMGLDWEGNKLIETIVSYTLTLERLKKIIGESSLGYHSFAASENSYTKDCKTLAKAIMRELKK